MGLSEHVQIGTLEERMEDVRAVMDAVGSERATFLGVVAGSGIVFEEQGSHVLKGLPGTWHLFSVV